MDVRATNEISIVLSFELQATLPEILQDGGFEEFAKAAHDKLDAELESLRGLSAMKKLAEAAMKPKEESGKS